MILFSKQQLITLGLTLLGTLITLFLLLFKTFRKQVNNKTIYFLLGSIGLNNSLICGVSFLIALRTRMLLKIVIAVVLAFFVFLLFFFVRRSMQKAKKRAYSSSYSSGVIALVSIFVILATHYLDIRNIKFEILTFASFLLFSLFSTFLLKVRPIRDGDQSGDGSMIEP